MCRVSTPISSGGMPLLVLLLLITISAATSDLGAVEVRYGVLENLGDSHTSNVTLTNTGSIDIDSESDVVSVYPCFIRPVLGSEAEGGYIVPDTEPGIRVEHLDGCAHKIVYSPPFKLAAGESNTIILKQKHWNVAYTDNMLNWFIQLGDGEYKTITNTESKPTEFVNPYDSKAKYLRSPSDKVLPLSLSDRYTAQVSDTAVDDDAARKRLIPDIFNSLETDEYTQQFNNVADLTVNIVNDALLADEEYKLTIAADGTVTVETNTTAGDDVVSKQVSIILTMLLERFDSKLPVGTFTTKKPRFGYRGFMLDLARHFHNKASVLRQLDLMSRYRLNKLHLHLADDESWSIEIEEIPELTQYGSKQCYDITSCATYPQLGRDLTNTEPKFLSKQDYIDIVQYAANLGITIVPEIELPGHSTAAINAMKIRYQIDPSAVDYRLHDPSDTSEYVSVQEFTAGAMNPCVNSTFTFLEKVIDTIKRYHSEAGYPLTLIHLAGDEVAEHAWMNSTMCSDLTSELGVNATEKERRSFIYKYMLTRLGELAGQQSLDVGFWEDGLIDKLTGRPYIKSEVFPASIDVYAFVWQTVWQWWGGDRAFRMANLDYKVVMAPATRFYLDFPQEPHPMERGYYWAARYIALLRAYAFRPINYYANIDGPKVMGEPNTRAEWCNPDKCPPLQPGKESNIVGVEAPLFGETISTDDHIDNNAWPRLLAVAERAWSEASWENLNGSSPEGLKEDFAQFRRSLEMYEIPALDKLNVNYHISPPGAIEKDSDDETITFRCSVEFKGQRVWWREEGSQTFTEAQSMEIQYIKGTKVYLKASDANNLRSSYEVEYKNVPAVTQSPDLTSPPNSTTLLTAITSLILTQLVLLAVLRRDAY